MFDLTGKAALITGASGGIGAEIARVLHGAGASVALSGMIRRIAKDSVTRAVGTPEDVVAAKG